MQPHDDPGVWFRASLGIHPLGHNPPLAILLQTCRSSCADTSKRSLARQLQNSWIKSRPCSGCGRWPWLDVLRHPAMKRRWRVERIAVLGVRSTLDSRHSCTNTLRQLIGRRRRWHFDPLTSATLSRPDVDPDKCAATLFINARPPSCRRLGASRPGAASEPEQPLPRGRACARTIFYRPPCRCKSPA